MRQGSEPPDAALAAWVAAPRNAPVSRPAPAPSPEAPSPEAPSPRDRRFPSEIERPGRAFRHQPGALDVAAHGAQVAVAGVAHDVFVPHAFFVRLGDEADTQRMGAQAVESVHRQPGRADAVSEDPAHGIGVQCGVTDAPGSADTAEQRAGFAPRDRLPGFEGPY